MCYYTVFQERLRLSRPTAQSHWFLEGLHADTTILPRNVLSHLSHGRVVWWCLNLSSCPLENWWAKWMRTSRFDFCPQSTVKHAEMGCHVLSMQMFSPHLDSFIIVQGGHKFNTSVCLLFICLLIQNATPSDFIIVCSKVVFSMPKWHSIKVILFHDNK